MRCWYSAVGYAAVVNRNVFKSEVVVDGQYDIRRRILRGVRWFRGTLLPGYATIIAYRRNEVRDDAGQVVPAL